MKITTHFMGNLVIKSIEGDVAETETNAIAFLVEPAAGSDVVAMRCLRYLDRMRREKTGWLISDRIHTLDWSCQVPANFALPLAQRVSTSPARSGEEFFTPCLRNSRKGLKHDVQNINQSSLVAPTGFEPVFQP